MSKDVYIMIYTCYQFRPVPAWTGQSFLAQLQEFPMWQRERQTKRIITNPYAVTRLWFNCKSLKFSPGWSGQVQ